MEEYLMTVMKRASVFMILSQALIHFRPNPSYEKYLKFLAGIMTMVILIIPVMEWSRTGITEQYNACVDRYMARMQAAASSRELSIDMTPSRSYLYKMGEEIKERLNDYFLEEGYEVRQVEIDIGDFREGEQPPEDYSIRIEMGENSREVSAIGIERITVAGDETAEENQEEAARSAAAARKEEFREMAAEILEIDEDKIEILWKTAGTE